MGAVDPIKIEGLRKFGRDLKTLDRELPKALRVALNEAGDVVVDWARPKVPSRSGRARRSVRAKSTRTRVRVAGGGRRAEYYPWLDFGGKVGRDGSISRPFIKEGRYLYQGYFSNRDRMGEVLQDALIRVANSSGLEVE